MLWKKWEPWLELDVHLRQRRLDDGPRARDLAPFHGDAEGGILAPPAAEADQEVGAARLEKGAVDRLDLGGHGARPHRVEFAGLDVDHVADRVCRARSPSRARRPRAPGRLPVLGCRDLDRLVGDGHRPHLQEPEARGPARRARAGSRRTRSPPSRRAPSWQIASSPRTRALSGHSSWTRIGAKVRTRGAAGPEAGREPVRGGIVGGGERTGACRPPRPPPGRPGGGTRSPRSGRRRAACPCSRPRSRPGSASGGRGRRCTAGPPAARRASRSSRAPPSTIVLPSPSARLTTPSSGRACPVA